MSLIWKGDFAGLPGKVVLASPMVCANTAKGDNKLYSDAGGYTPSLDLRFASNKNLNDFVSGTPLVDHQRSMSGSNLSPGTFVNSSGLIETAKVNLFTYSEDLTQRTTIDATTPSSTLLQATTQSGNQTPYAADNTFTFPKANTVYTVYADFQKISVQYATINFQLFDLDGLCVYDLDTGLVSNEPAGFTCSMNEITSGVYRCTATFTTGSTDLTGRVSVGMSELPTIHRITDPTTSDQIFIYRIQIEEGSTATTYIPTTNVPSAAPRFDHDPTTGESLGLLVEESRTNLLEYSEEFGNNGWAKFKSSVTENAVTAPDGNTTADKLTEDTATGAHALQWLNIPGLNTATANVYSIYAKAGERSRISIGCIGNSGLLVNNPRATFDLSNGTVISVGDNPTTATITSVGNGWYRCTISRPTFDAGRYIIALNDGTSDSYTGDGTSGLYIWGAQVEAGSFATSYIPTTGTALTRSADVANITGTNFSSWYNQSKGTAFIETLPKNYSLADLFMFGTNKSFNPSSWGVYQPGANNDYQFYGRINSAYDFNASISNSDAASKLSFGLSGTTYSASYDGNTVTTGSNSGVPTGINTLEFNKGVYGISSIYVKRFTYFPERLPDANLQAMTAP